jgi:Ssl1-like
MELHRALALRPSYCCQAQDPIWRPCPLLRAQANPGAAQVLILLSALSTCDPGNILDSLKLAKQHRARVSVVGLSAQVHICETLTQVRR